MSNSRADAPRGGRSFLGRGIGFPLGVDGAGNLAMSAHDENIEQSVRIILGTAPGERLYRPFFGCRIHDQIFAPNNAHTRSLVAFHAREALLKWEPRIDDIEVTCRPDAGAENTLLLHVRYKVRATNSAHNLVYPFFLRREDEP